MPSEITDDELEDDLTSWRWRFTNLYWIKPKDKRPKILFNPKPEQWEILEAIYERGEVRIAILKARQLGFSTLIALICLDMAMFMAGFTIGIVDQTKEDAKKKLAKVFLAWENLPDDIKASYEIVTENKSEFSIRCGDDSTSTIYAGTNARGGTHQLLWISEWGPIQIEDATRSDKIADGALPSADEGVIVVETTWRGGRTGRLYEEVVRPAMAIRDEFRTVKDWKIYFYAWWLDPAYVFDGDFAQITDDCLKYFAELKTDEAVELNEGQMLWYFKVCWPKGHSRFEEFPSCMKEMFDTPLKGAIYATEIIKAKIEGRVFPFKVDESYPVDTAWDLGSPENLVVIYFQYINFGYRIIDCDHGLNMTTSERVSHMHNKGYNFGVHGLPHDGNTRGSDALSFKRKLKEAKLSGQIKTIEREPHRAEEKRIMLMLDLFPSIFWNESTLSDEGGLIDALSAYRYKKNPQDGKITSQIVHDWANHFGNTFGYIGEGAKKRVFSSSFVHAERPQSAETKVHAPGKAQSRQQSRQRSNQAQM